MPTMADEFSKSRYVPKYEFMARVQGTYKKVPFVGSVGNDTVISEAQGPVLHIHLDLPMKIDGKVTDHLFCKHSEITHLKRRK